MVTQILIWSGGMSLLVAFLPEKRAKRVHAFIKMIFTLLPISKIAEFFKKKNDK